MRNEAVADRDLSSAERDLRQPWLTYRQAAEYCGWSITYVRNLVSAGQIPVYAHLGSGAQRRLIETLQPARAPHERPSCEAHVNLVSTDPGARDGEMR
jgi:excisionase family DNA binding protein